MLVNIEQFNLMVFHRIFQTLNDDIHDLVVDIKSSQVPEINMHCCFHCIILKSDFKQINELSVRYLTQLRSQKVLIVIILSIHLEYQKYLFSIDQESFSVILSNTRFCCVINQNFFVVSLIVSSVRL